MTLQEFTGFIRDVGFPCFIALYMVVSLGPKFDRLTRTIDRLAGHIGAPGSEVKR